MGEAKRKRDQEMPLTDQQYAALDRYLNPVIAAERDTVLIGPSVRVAPPTGGWAFMIIAGILGDTDTQPGGRYLTFATRDEIELVRESMVVRLLYLARDGLSVHVFREMPHLLSFAETLWPRHFGQLADDAELGMKH